MDLFSLEPLCALDTESPAPDDTETFGLFYGLGPQALKALHEPAETGRRSEAEQSVIYRAACIGWTLADVSELFRKEAASGTKYHEKVKAGHGEKWLEAGYRAAVRHAGKAMSPDLQAINQALSALAEGLNPFSGRGAWTDVAAFRVVLQVRRETRSPWIGGSLRYLADRSGLDTMRFMKALDRLEEAGALRISRLPGSVLMAESPEFVDTLFAKRYISSHSLRVQSEQSEARQSPALAVRSEHDAYRHAALGKPGLELVRRLNARKGEAWSLAELAGSDIGYWYLRRVVALLESVGIVERAGSRKGAGRSATLYTCPHGLRFSDLDKVAAVAGTSGMGARQTARHAADRKAWHALKPGGACTAEL